MNELVGPLAAFFTSPEGASLAVIVSTAIFFMTAERFFPYQKGRKLFRVGYFTDFFWYTIVQSYLLGVVIGALIAFIDDATPLERWTVVRDLPLWAQVVLFLVAHDFYIYWFHRLQHANRWLWRTHEAHHSVRDVDWLAGSRSHAVEILINQTIEFAPIVLLASPEVAVIKATIDSVWGMYIHSNLNVRTGWLQRIINGPEMHRWHHSNELVDVNFSTKLAVWDWLFKTAYLPDHKPRSYGLVGEVFPEGFFAYFKHHWISIRPFDQKVRADLAGQAPSRGEPPEPEPEPATMPSAVGAVWSADHET